MKRITLFLILVAAVLSAGPSARAETCGCDVSPASVALYDRVLQSAAGLEEQAPWGVPITAVPPARADILGQPDWMTGYDPDLKIPVWVVYRLRAEDLARPRARTQCFRPDPRLKAMEAAGCASYRGSGFDRGHMVPSADMTRSEAAMVNTYVFSNIAPQYAAFNRGVWAQLERDVRDLARTHGTIYIVTGAIFDYDGDGRRDEAADAPRAGGGVAVASHFYKVVAWAGADGRVTVRAWLLRHDRLQGHEATRIAAARTDLAAIEQLTSLDIMPLLRTVTEQAEAR